MCRCHADPLNSTDREESIYSKSSSGPILTYISALKGGWAFFRGLTRVLTHCFPCVIKLITVFHVHSVLEYQRQPLQDLPDARSWAAPDWGKWCMVRQGRRNGPTITYKITPCWVTLFQPARREAVLGQPSRLRPHWLDLRLDFFE
jgi:hypothetical protein